MSRARATGRVAHLSTLHPPRDNRIFNKECASLAREGVDLWFIGAQDGDGVDQGVDGIEVGQVAGDRTCRAAVVGDAVGDGVEQVGAASHHDDVGARFGEHFCTTEALDYIPKNQCFVA
mgnify:CR=1 FL=1